MNKQKAIRKEMVESIEFKEEVDKIFKNKKLINGEEILDKIHTGIIIASIIIGIFAGLNLAFGKYFNAFLGFLIFAIYLNEARIIEKQLEWK